ncbi:hypothetical protein H5410_038110 [Solanum commersonii]|uniref:Uncharacterized protein n=1 Tax=Solanum commersonii TaxID=4109 RepID=A0A9J5YD12_SOLCO|nr:hypothetical protein H5410_038110 [Solanum commersonii]
MHSTLICPTAVRNGESLFLQNNPGRGWWEEQLWFEGSYVTGDQDQSEGGEEGLTLSQHLQYQAKIPDIEKCLDIVATLQAKKDSSEICNLMER